MENSEVTSLKEQAQKLENKIRKKLDGKPLIVILGVMSELTADLFEYAKEESDLPKDNIEAIALMLIDALQDIVIDDEALSSIKLQSYVNPELH